MHPRSKQELRQVCRRHRTSHGCGLSRSVYRRDRLIDSHTRKLEVVPSPRIVRRTPPGSFTAQFHLHCPHIWRRCRFEVPPGSGLIIEAAKDDSAWATGGGVFMKSIPGSKRSVTGYSDSKAGPYPFSAPISSDLSMQARSRSLFWPMSPSERHRARITDRTADARGFRCKTYVHIYQDRMRWQECDRD